MLILKKYSNIKQTNLGGLMKSRFVLISFLLVLIGTEYVFATSPTLPLSCDIGVGLDRYGLRIGKPFSMGARWWVGAKAEQATIDITLPEGMELLEGNLHWEGEKFWEGYSNVRIGVLSRALTVKINKPGTYEVFIVMNVINIQNTLYMKHIPVRKFLYFYAREDTIAVFWNKDEMERKIRDSLIVPEEVILERWHQKNKEEYLKSHPTEFVFQPPQRVPDYWWNYELRIFQNSVAADENYLQTRFSNEQKAFIKKHNLIYQKPDFSKIYSQLRDSTIYPDFSRVPMDKERNLQSLIQKHLLEIYEVDKKMLHVNSYQFEAWLKEREKLLTKHSQELVDFMTATLETTKP